jgi:hypothetical protein
MVLPMTLAITSCDLETSPTTSVSGSGMFANATAAKVPLNGIYRMMYTSGWSTTGNTHQCFGISAYNLMADVMGEDMVMSGQGSGWFWYDCTYNVKSRFASSTWRSYDLWFGYYQLITNANYIIAAEETMEGAPADVNNIIGQAYALRAYSYFYLAQSFARTYKGHESDPGVPIYTEPTTAQTEGQPRSTVAQVYEQILKDINRAIELLDGASPRDHVSQIDYSVANGIKAKICLTMENWSEASAAAKEARGTKKIGAPADLQSGMNRVTLPNVMWGAEIIADQSGMYAGFFTHMDADAGAYGATARKLINRELYALLGEKDVRRDWWNPQDAVAYQQEKFKFIDQGTWTGDYIWMRTEEMLLMEAEAECRLGNNEKAQELLKELMANRDPDYDVTKTGTALGALTTDYTGSLLEEIIIQRRIELWGEAGRIYDIRRLKQGFVRTAAMGWPSNALIEGTDTKDPDSYAWVMTIPQAEFDANESLNQATDQNPLGDH